MSKFSISVCKWNILENDLKCFTLTMGAGKVRLKVNDYGWGGQLDFILYSSMKFPLCFHLQTGSGCHPLFSCLGTLPGVWSYHQNSVPRLKMISFENSSPLRHDTMYKILNVQDAQSWTLGCPSNWILYSGT
jgi:hypothetical protein